MRKLVKASDYGLNYHLVRILPLTLWRTTVAEGWEKMARPEGFEPPTNGFGSHYSIRLSYGRADGIAYPKPARSPMGVLRAREIRGMAWAACDCPLSPGR